MSDAKKPVDWDELYPGRFLKAGELRKQIVTLTISDVTTEMLEGDDGPRLKGLISFAETKRQLALNKTNGICIREMFGRSLAAWQGKRVSLHEGQHKGQPCIRIYGSPDLTADREIIVKLPKKAPQKMTMKSVKPKGSQ